MNGVRDGALGSIGHLVHQLCLDLLQVLVLVQEAVQPGSIGFKRPRGFGDDAIALAEGRFDH